MTYLVLLFWCVSVHVVPLPSREACQRTLQSVRDDVERLNEIPTRAITAVCQDAPSPLPTCRRYRMVYWSTPDLPDGYP